MNPFEDEVVQDTIDHGSILIVDSEESSCWWKKEINLSNQPKNLKKDFISWLQKILLECTP